MSDIEVTTDDLLAQLQEAYARIGVLEVQVRALLRTIREMSKPEPEPEPAE